MRFLTGKRFLYTITWMAWSGMHFFTYAQNVLYPFVENGKIGYKDSLDQVRLHPQFDYIEEFSQGRQWTVVGIGTYELLSHNLDQRKLNFAGKFGLIDQYGDFIFRPVFTIILSLDSLYAIVGNGTGHIHFENFPEEKNYEFKGDLGVVNIHGDTVVPLHYQTIQKLTSGIQAYWFAKNPDMNVLYSSGKKIWLGGNIKSIDNFSEGLARYESETGYGFMTTEGQMVIPPVYARSTHFIQGRAWVKKQDEYFFINKKGERIDSSRMKFDEMAPFSDGLALVRIFDEYGYIKPDSTFFIKPEFLEAGSFFNGITYVSTIDSFGYIRQDGWRDLVQRYEKDPLTAGKIREKQPADFKGFVIIPNHSQDTSVFNMPFDSLDLSGFISVQLEALRWAPYLYYKYPQMLARVSAGEGTLAGRHQFNFSFFNTGSQPWESFKQKVIFVILKDKKLRSLAWDWLKPFYKKVFDSMPEQHQEVYREMVQYLSKYFDDYSKEKIEQFLIDDPDQFAYQHWDGSISPYRKVSAFLERLIFIHHVMEPEDVQYWIRKIRDEIKNL
jgi:hypothetical protein